MFRNVREEAHKTGGPYFSIYCASKWAIEGFTEALSHEIKPEWGIKLTCIEPGAFRTDFLGRSVEFGEVKNDAYNHMNPREIAQSNHNNQGGDPAKAAKVFYDLAIMKDPPLRCILGSDAYKAMTAKVETTKENLERFKDWTHTTDVDSQ